jgi:hypothetical protein
MFRKGLAAAAMITLACSATVWATDIGTSVAQETSKPGLFDPIQPSTPMLLDDSTAPAAAAPAAPSGPTSLTPVMFLLDPTPVGKWMEANKLSVTGFVDAGFWYDTNNPHMGNHGDSDAPTFVSFPGGFSNRGVLDQLDLTLQKSLDTTKSWDWGFLFENGYGIDDSQIHSYGVFDHRAAGSAFNKGGTGEGTYPDNQYDIIQADVSLLVPVGTGLTITGGKFVGLLSQEVINPTGNVFYTHSYNFFYGVAGTLTGITGSYTFPKLFNGNDVSIYGGITRGWNESTRDNNGAVDGIFQVKTSLTSTITDAVNIEEGPEGLEDNSNYWTQLEDILTYTASDQLTFTGDFLYVDYPHGGVVDTDTNAQWYGSVFYASYKFNSYLTANARAEWYRDQGGFSTGNQANYYEATVGVQIHPLPNDNIFQFLQFRPEVRQDWSDRPVYDLAHADGTGDYQQFSVAFDALMQY